MRLSKYQAFITVHLIRYFIVVEYRSTRVGRISAHSSLSIFHIYPSVDRKSAVLTIKHVFSNIVVNAIPNSNTPKTDFDSLEKVLLRTILLNHKFAYDFKARTSTNTHSNSISVVSLTLDEEE